MRSPDVFPFKAPADEIVEDKRNGHGSWMLLPVPSAPLKEALPALADHGDFTEMPDIIEQLTSHGNVLVSGAPGSGKSHLVRDLQSAAVFNCLPTFCLAVHINAGKSEGVANATTQLDEFRDKVNYSGGGLVILDNIDYVGYRGRSRTRCRSRDYAHAMKPLVEDLLADDKLAVIATAHDSAWRRGKCTWRDDEIDKPAQAILEAFDAQVEFEGKVGLSGLAHLLRERRLKELRLQQLGLIKGEEPNGTIEETFTEDQAAQVVRRLQAAHRANFFHANHLPIELFLRDPEAAIARIELGRDQRRGLA